MRFIKEPINQFIRLETSASIVLFLATVLALALANSPLNEAFRDFWQNPLTVGTPGFMLSKPLVLWVNDGLMAIFFFLIGLELKRELLTGELSSFKKASLPVFAAIGGMVVPALLFTFFNHNKPGADGWGIPMAADIAFSLGILKLLGKRVPAGLKIFLTAFAIVDDLGAVLVIALFYSDDILWKYILYALLIVTFLLLMTHQNRYSKYFYFVSGVAVWFLFLKSGIHPTVAGVLMALTIPLAREEETLSFYNGTQEALDDFLKECKPGQTKAILTENQLGSLGAIGILTEKATPPLQYLEHKLHGWVSYLIMPVFALTNAGVAISLSGNLDLNLAITLAISMFVGNIVGIATFSLLAIKLKIAELPEQVTPAQIVGVSFLGGLGFTMALFISNLAYTDSVLADSSKAGILLGSFFAGLIGFFVLRWILRSKKES